MYTFQISIPWIHISTLWRLLGFTIIRMCSFDNMALWKAMSAFPTKDHMRPTAIAVSQNVPEFYPN